MSIKNTRGLSLAEKLKNRLMRNYKACVVTGPNWSCSTYFAKIYLQHPGGYCKAYLRAQTELEVVILAYHYIIKHREEFIYAL